jgi:hypothetical protein
MTKLERITDALRAARNKTQRCCDKFVSTNLEAVWDLRDSIEQQGAPCQIRRNGAEYSLVMSTGVLAICEATEWALHMVDEEITDSKEQTHESND